MPHSKQLQRFEVLLDPFEAVEEISGEKGMAIVANRYWILFALLAAAVVCYSVGFIAGVGLFFAAGVLLELGFWYGLLKRNRRR